jgi:hypothetical protein
MTDWKAIAQAHNDSLVARIEENKRLRSKVKQLTELLDNQLSTPCEQIQHQEEIAGLRAEVERLSNELNIEQMDSMTGRQMVSELRAENERLRGMHPDKLRSYISSREATLRAENKRLREALEKADEGLNFLHLYDRAALNRVEESALSAESATYNERWKSKP